GDDAAVRVAHLQPRIERRAEPGRVDLASDRLPLAERDRPDVDVLSRKDPAVDCDRQPHVHRDRVAVDLLLDDFWQIADHELEPPPPPPRRPQPPVPTAQRGVAAVAPLPRHVARVVLGLLRLGQRKQRPLEPSPGNVTQPPAYLDAGAE